MENSTSKNMKRDRFFMLGAMVLALAAIAALIFFFTSTADAAPSASRSPIDLPEEEFTSTDITPTDITPTDITPTDITPTDVTPTDVPVTFKDVKETDWFYDGVKYAVQKGLMNGVENNRFDPDGTLTRAMLVTVLYRLAGQPQDLTAAIPFTDVKAGEWYYNAVVWAYQNEVANGTSETTFEPDAPVTREQLVTLLWRYAGQPASSKDLSSFPDAGKISDYAVTAARWAVENGIVNGKEGGRFDPEGNATRAEIAVIFMRAGEALES